MNIRLDSIPKYPGCTQEKARRHNRNISRTAGDTMNGDDLMNVGCDVKSDRLEILRHL